MDLTAVTGLQSLTRELIKTHRKTAQRVPVSLPDHLWSVVEQEMLRYSCSMSDECATALRQLVAQGAETVGEVEAPAEAIAVYVQDDPEVVVTSNVYAHLETQPVRYLIYGLRVHRHRQEELAEAALRTLVLSMITTAKEGESDELTLQTLGAVKSRLCPWWPFWTPKDC